MNVINSIWRYVIEATQSVKIAAGTSLVTITTAKISEWIPTTLADIGIIIGAALSIVLIYTHIRKHFRGKESHIIEMAKKKLELEILQTKVEKK